MISIIVVYIYNTVPSAPTVLATRNNSTSTSFLLVWSQQSEDFIKGFNVTVTYSGPCHDFSDITQITLSNSSLREFHILGLQEYSNYSIAIAAFNDNGSSSQSILNITTHSSGMFTLL